MDLDRYISTHRAEWVRLEELSKKASGSLDKMRDAEIDEFLHLYQRTTSHLSFARDHYNDASLNAELYSLVGNAGSVLYRRTSSPKQSFRQFFSVSFPAAVWHIRRIIALAFLASAIPAALIAIWLSNSPRAMDTVASESERSVYVEEEFEGYYSSGPASIFAAEVLTNNIQVSFLAYGLGVLFCVGSIYILAVNGIFFGTALSLFIVAGQQSRFWGLIAPHGLLELSAIFVAGAAGISMGWALIDPGDRTRADAFAAEARRSVTIIMGLALAFIVAAIIEAFITPSQLPTAARILVGFLVWASFLGYIVSFGQAAVSRGLTGLYEDEIEGDTADIALSV